MGKELPSELTVADSAAWRSWLSEHHEDRAGVWLTLAKKGISEPTSLTYDQALDEALCHGWIDGQVRRRDEATFKQRFTPRRARSGWSKRNVAIVGRLTAEGRMHHAGLEAVASAKADGRWQAAYHGPATIEVPADLAAALSADPRALAMFVAPHEPEPLRHSLPPNRAEAPSYPRAADRGVRRDARSRRDDPPAEATPEVDAWATPTAALANDLPR